MSQQYSPNQSMNGGYMAPPQTQPPKAPQRTGVFTLVGMVVLIFAILVILNETMLKIRHVAVVGNEKKTWEEIVRTAELDRPVSYFTVNEKTVARNLQSDRYLVLERMEKVFPNGLTLFVHERQPIARVQEMGMEYVLDEEGMVLEQYLISTSGDYGELMFVTGLKPKEMRMGQVMQPGSALQAEALKALLREVILQGITGEISELNVADPENLYLITTDKFTAHLGNMDDLCAKIGTVRAVVAYLRGAGSTGGMLEANIPGEVIYSPLSP